MNIILCGYNWIGCKILSELKQKNHNVFVYTHESPHHVNSMTELCEKYAVPFSTKKISLAQLPFKPDVIISAYYRYIIGNDLIKLVNGKIFNLHPSLLPDYKGCSSLTWAMINGEKQVGFTYHYISEKVDAGNIILQKSIAVEDWDTQITLYHRVMFEAAGVFAEALELVTTGFVGTIQEDSGRYYKRGCPHDGMIDSNWEPAKTERFIRAMVYPPLPAAKFKDLDVKSWSDFLKIKQEKN